MSNKVVVETVLSADELLEIKSFCTQKTELPEIVNFISDKFGIKVSLDKDIIDGFIADSSNLPGMASAVARPSTEKECAILFSALYQAGIPFTISGGKSNLTGSATPSEGIIVSLSNMLKPEITVNEELKEVTSSIGIILEDMRNEVLEKSSGDLIFPVDPTSRAEAAVGGSLACNASGFTPGAQGSMRYWVKELHVLLPDGNKIVAKRDQYISDNGEFVFNCNGKEKVVPIPRHPRAEIKNAGGPFSAENGKMDIIDLFVGSEGIFGIITQCTLTLQNKPKDYLDLFFSLPEEADAIKLRTYLGEHIDGGVESLSALEYFGQNGRNYMKNEEVLFNGDDKVGVYVQVPLFDQELEDVAEVWLDMLMDANCNINDDAIILMDSDRDREIFQEARHSLPANSLEVVQHRGTFTIMTDALVPEGKFAEFMEFTNNLIDSASMDYLSFGHLGDCHIHFMILPTKNQLDEAVNIYDKIIAKSAELGGIYSGEHGTGKRKRKDFIKCHGELGIEEIRKTKISLDPEFLLNRENVISFNENSI